MEILLHNAARFAVIYVAAWMAGGYTDRLDAANSALTGTFCSIPIEDRDEGAGLFKNKTFGGNGRTCSTCHPAEGAFTVSPEAAQARFAADPQDPLFVFDGSDDGHGNGVTRILRDATILIPRGLPPWLAMAGDPSVQSIVVARGIPTLLDIGVEATLPAPAIMLDGRAPNLQGQALGAVMGHYQPKQLPQPEQLQTIATFETSEAFFDSPAMADAACGGPAVDLPEGTTDSERRGREFFVPRPQPPSNQPQNFRCSTCHSGPLLNEVQFAPRGANPNGQRFMDALVLFSAPREQLFDMVLTTSVGQKMTITTTDPGRALTAVVSGVGCAPTCTTNPLGFVACGRCLPCSNFVQFNPALAGRENNICAVLPSSVVNAFKIPSLRGISKTAPYFHDNSARTLEQVVNHYVDFFEFHFQRTNGVEDGRLSPQDVEDIVAFLKLL